MLSDDDSEDDDYVPASLASFLKQADDALNEQTQMFLNEFSPSPTPNQSRESADCEVSNLDELQSNMANISILDGPNSANISARSDDSAFASPVARNPAADLTFTAAKRSVLGEFTPTSASAMEEKKAPHGQSERNEDSIQAEGVADSDPDGNLKPKPSLPTISSESANAVSEYNADPNLGATSFTLESQPDADPTSPHAEVITCSPAATPREVDQQKGVAKKNDVDESQPLLAATLGQEGNQGPENGGKSATSPGDIDAVDASHDPLRDNGASHCEKQETSSTYGLKTPTGDDSKQMFQLELTRNESQELGTPTSIDSSVDSGKGPFEEADRDEFNFSVATRDPVVDEATEIAKDSNPSIVSTPTGTLLPKAALNAEATSQPESRSLFGTFASFARSVVPTNKNDQPEQNLTRTFQLEKLEACDKSLGRLSPGQIRSQNTTSSAASPSEPVVANDEVMQDVEPARGQIPQSSNRSSDMVLRAPAPISTAAAHTTEVIMTGPQNRISCNDEMETEKVFSEEMQLDETGPTKSPRNENLGVSPASLPYIGHTKEPIDQAPPTQFNNASPPTKLPISPLGRLVQPTASSRRHTTSAEKRAASTPSSNGASRGQAFSPVNRSTPPTRIPMPSTVRIKTSEKRSAAPAAEATTSSKNRFMRPTASKRAHTSMQGSSGAKGVASKSGHQLPNRLMQRTAARNARVSSSPPSVLPQKRVGPDDAVARARERVRLRKLQESKVPFRSHDTKFNIGTKPREKPRVARDTTSRGSGSKAGSPHFATPTSSTKAHRKPPTVSMAQSAVFFGRALRDDTSLAAPLPRDAQRAGKNTPRLSSRLMRGTAASRAMTQAPPKFDVVSRDGSKIPKAPVVSMAQSSDVFGKGLRGQSLPVSRTWRAPGLTIPQAPKFATSAKYGNTSKKTSSPATTVSLAQSTNFLANTLRGYEAAPVSRGTRNQLTRPQSPKFHTTHKRPLPKSSAQIEEERMKNVRAHPFRAKQKATHSGANQNSLHTGSSTGLSKVTKRTLTRPEPFQLSSGSRSTRMKHTGAACTPLRATTQFRARPLPVSTSRPRRSVEEKRTITTPQPFSFAVNMKANTTTSGRTSNRNNPKSFKARKLPESTFKGPTIPVHTLTSPEAKVQKKEVSYRNNRPPPTPAPAKQSKSPTTPAPFQLESVKRHDAFQELMHEKVSAEEEEFKKNSCPKALPLPESTYAPDILT